MRTTLLIALILPWNAAAQSSPADLAQTVAARWTAASESDFRAVYPYREGRNDYTTAVRALIDRAPGLSAVIRSSSNSAVLLLSGVPVGLNSGDDTVNGRGFSGVYEAQPTDGVWKLSRRLSLDEIGRIRAQNLSVRVRPAFGVEVEDHLSIQALGSNGFAARLNHAAKLDSVTLDGHPVRHLFGGGLLWVDAPAGNAELALKYSIEVEEGPNNSNSSAFLRKAGHLRNQYIWHPFFDFFSGADRADFRIEARIPKEYRLSTSLPQTERIEGAERIVTGKSNSPASALTLVYDRDWQPLTEQIGSIRLEVFATPQFRPTREAVVAEFRKIYAQLAERFGDPGGGYFGVVEARSKEGNGWHFASNQIVVAAGWPMVFSQKDRYPGAFLGHEIAHLWTHGAGPAANFLSEGWATYAESLLLAGEYGPDTATLFWKQHADDYFRQHDGKASLVEDENNSGVAYTKGPWLFRMLAEAAGPEAFQKALAEYSRLSARQAAPWESLADCFDHQHIDGFDARAFLRPWLEQTRAPGLEARVEGPRVTIVQSAPGFELPLTVSADTADGPQRRRIWVRGAETTIDFQAPVSAVRLDPDGLLLLKPARPVK